MSQIQVTQKRSLIGQTERTRQTVRGLGLRRIGHTVYLKDTAACRGMITHVQHLLQVQVLPGEAERFGVRHNREPK